MKIIIPMAGTGNRFVEAGYEDPKPLIKVNGKRIIEYILEMFEEEDVVFICNETHLNNTKMYDVLKKLKPKSTIISMKNHKLGPVYTVKKAYDYILDDEEVIISYCDNPYVWDRADFNTYVKENELDGCILSHTGFHPHTLAQTSSIKKRVHPFAPRGSKPFDFFLQEEEVGKNPTANIQNNGHIPITQLKGNRSFETLITGSGFKLISCSYEIQVGGTSKISSRLLSASYFYPFSQYQLGVLRENETVVLNLNKPQELPQGLGDLGYALVPENTSRLVKDNLEFFLEKAGLLDKTTTTFVDNRTERGGGKLMFAGGIGQGSDLGSVPSINNSEDEEEIGEGTDDADSPSNNPGGGSANPTPGGGGSILY